MRTLYSRPAEYTGRYLEGRQLHGAVIAGMQRLQCLATATGGYIPLEEASRPECQGVLTSFTFVQATTLETDRPMQRSVESTLAYSLFFMVRVTTRQSATATQILKFSIVQVMVGRIERCMYVNITLACIHEAHDVDGKTSGG